MRVPVRLLLLFLAVTAALDVAFAAEEWRIRKLPGESIRTAGDGELQGAPDGLPDGLVARADGSADIAAAWYVDPTRRYRHGILGDAVEAAGLRVETRDGRLLTFRLPEELKPFNLTGEVVWCGAHGCGIRFNDISKQQAVRLQIFSEAEAAVYNIIS